MIQGSDEVDARSIGEVRHPVDRIVERLLTDTDRRGLAASPPKGEINGNPG